ncbi:hypothetical protein F8388_017201 [Cannabis sativa]|uniref:RNase H type-1 domain-containing protein n=1 Tax=Cannabis sativa TaxID=3483 RepID=A0A7J6FWH9_CANSA|nr:hypothetical protein F8388_017201 [Cannabis sativa]
MVNQVGLIDLSFLGPKVTWCKNTRGQGLSPSLKITQLDRALASMDWRMLLPHAIVKHLVSTVSDHKPILLDTTGGIRGNGSFKYKNMWARDQTCYWVVKQAWIDDEIRKSINFMGCDKALGPGILAMTIPHQSGFIIRFAFHFQACLGSSYAWLVGVNTDITIGKENSFRAAFFLDVNEGVVGAFSKKYNQKNPLKGELIALILAAEQAGVQKFKNIIFYSDSSPIVKAIQEMDMQEINFFIFELVKVVTLKLDCCEIIWIPQIYNSLAHNTAQWAKRNEFEGMISVDNLATTAWRNLGMEVDCYHPLI